jgi:hypothetical protein
MVMLVCSMHAAAHCSRTAMQVLAMLVKTAEDLNAGAHAKQLSWQLTHML